MASGKKIQHSLPKKIFFWHQDAPISLVLAFSFLHNLRAAAVALCAAGGRGGGRGEGWRTQHGTGPDTLGASEHRAILATFRHSLEEAKESVDVLKMAFGLTHSMHMFLV
jgi:hypothetical protein